MAFGKWVKYRSIKKNNEQNWKKTDRKSRNFNKDIKGTANLFIYFQNKKNQIFIKKMKKSIKVKKNWHSHSCVLNLYKSI